MSGNGALVGAAVGDGVVPVRAVPPSAPVVVATEAESELVPPEAGSKALVKSFISTRSFETLSVLARMLVAAPEFPEALRNDTLKALEGIKTKEHREIISDALKAYKPYTSRLPRGGAEEVSTWCQDRSQHHNLYTILGTTAALASILAVDQTLIQRVVATGLREESAGVIDELNKRLLVHYKASLGDPTSACAQALVAEGKEKNPMAVTLYLKGFLAPLLELERPAKRVLFGLFSVADKADTPQGLHNLCDLPWTEKRAADLGVLTGEAAQALYKGEREKQQKERELQQEQERAKQEAVEREAAAREATQRAARLEREQQENAKREVEQKEFKAKKAAEEAARLEREKEEDKKGLKGITLVKSIDSRFVQRVLAAQGTANEKVAFLTAAVGLATTVDESAIIELAERIQELPGVSLKGGAQETQTDRLVNLMQANNIGSWSAAETGPYGPAMLAVALSKCSGLRNPAYAEVIKARFSAQCEAWKGEWKKEFVSDLITLISRLVAVALEKGVDLSDS